MTREEMALKARRGVDILEGELELPIGARVVVIVTDDEGAFVGVAGSSNEADRDAMIFCAACGLDRTEHGVRRG